MVCVAGQDGVLQVKRVLIIKTSSMGDVVHTLPALTDAVRAMPGVTFDWVVEEGLAEVPRWHPSVDRVLKVAIRRWRRSWWSGETRGERRRFRAELREREYDAVIDAQGLIKSAWLSMQARGRRHGLSWGSAREGISSLACHERHAVARSQHAILRVRQLFAASLGYGLGATEPDYGIDRNRLAEGALSRASVVLLHGTTWETKHWPEAYWLALAKQAGAAGFEVLMPWGNDRERDRAARIASGCGSVRVLDRLGLGQIAGLLAASSGVVAVDTGLAHVAAALGVPAVTLYGATEPGLTGTVGANQVQMRAEFACAPCLQRRCSFTGPSEVQPACYGTLPPTAVWARLNGLMGGIRL